MGLLTISITDPPPGESLAMDVLSVEYASQNFVASHPIEQAADVSDHIVRQLDELHVQAIVTDTPFVNSQLQPVGARLPTRIAQDFLDRAAAGTVALRIGGQPVRTRYALLSWSWRQDQLQRAIWSLRFREIRIARALSVRISVRAAPDTPAAPSEQDLGQQATKDGGTSLIGGLFGVGG